MNLPRLLCLAAAAALFSGCASAPQPAPPAISPAIVLVSIDGLRADALDLGLTPTINALAARGVRAEAMTPSYPSLTFPNHYTLVTGLRPDRHGIINNTMHDAALGGFKLSDLAAVGNAAWWGGEPIWVGAEKAGIKTATGSWPGSEAPIQGIRPQLSRPYDETVAPADRVEQILEWITPADGSAPPRLLTLYLEQVDKAGHAYGPESVQYRDAVQRADAAVGQLVQGLAARHVLDSTNIIVVSDHGMATVKPGQQVAVEDMVPAALAKVISTGQSVGFEPLPGKEAKARAALIGRHSHYQCWDKAALPTAWHYGTHPRIPSIICQMDEGWDALPRVALASRGARERGSHGYAPTLPSMQAMFVAAGPSFQQGKRLPRFDNVDVYPMLAQLLGVTPADHDGDVQALKPALR